MRSSCAVSCEWAGAADCAKCPKRQMNSYMPFADSLHARKRARMLAPPTCSSPVQCELQPGKGGGGFLAQLRACCPCMRCAAPSAAATHAAQSERDAAVADLEATRETSKLLEEELASLKQRLRQTEVQI